MCRPTFAEPRKSILLPLFANTADPPMALVAVPRFSVLTFRDVSTAWVMLPLICPTVAVSSPSTRPPLTALMLGSCRSLVPRMVMAAAALLVVEMVPLRAMVPEAVPSCPVSVMVPPWSALRGEICVPPVALMAPADWTMP